MKIKKLITAMMAIVLVVSCVAPAFASGRFDDVAAGSWYSADVDYVYSHGLMSGVSDSSFAPDVHMNRAMLVTVLYRMEGEPEPQVRVPFGDVEEGAWYYKAVAWAYENGIVNGVSESSFAPGNNVSREQMVTIICRYAEYKGVKNFQKTDLSGYYDSGSVASYARDAFAWAVKAGVINGTSQTELSPKGTATRAQCAAILHRFAIWMEENGRPTPPDGYENGMGWA